MNNNLTNMIKDFLNRNFPIIAIGGFTILAFAGVIYLAQTNSQPTKLKELTNNELVPDNANYLGKQDAPFTLVEFSDFQCPACKAYEPSVKALLAKYPNELKLVYRQFPLVSIHAYAYPASQAAIAAGMQGKFWEYHSLLFENQPTKEKTDTFEYDKLVNYANSLNLDITKFENDFKSTEVKNIIDKDITDGNSFGIRGTPTFYLNGKQVDSKNFQLNIETEINRFLESQKEVFKGIDLKTVDNQFSPANIIYTSQTGFTPTKITANFAQKVLITNNSNQILELVQTSNTYVEFQGKNITILPGDTFDFRLYEKSIWTLQNKEGTYKLEIDSLTNELN